MKPNSIPLRRFREKGQIIIIVGVSLVVLIGMVGLAIDSGRAYGVRAKLNAAVDSAAIAAARSLSQNDISLAQNTAVRYFNANFPANYLGSTRATPTVSASQDPTTRAWTVTTSGSAVMPVTFLNVLGIGPVTIAASGTAIRRSLDAMMVIDTSGSLVSDFSTLKQAAITGFVNKFNPGSDRVGLVSFASDATLNVPIDKTAARGFNLTSVRNAINGLTAGGGTATGEGMRLAQGELDAIPASLRSDLRVILLFTDGAPNMVNGVFPTSPVCSAINGTAVNLYSEADPTRDYRCGGSYACTAGSCTQVACRWFPSSGPTPPNGTDCTWITSLPPTGSGGIPLTSYNGKRTLSLFNGGPNYTNNRCNVNKAARNMVENIANNARSEATPIFVYTIGLGVALTSLEVTFCGYSAAEQGTNILNRLANTLSSDTRNAAQPTGMYCYAATSSQLQACFSAIASEVLRLAM